MTDRDVVVTEDELHAYVDGQLPAERRDAVEAWLGTHPDDAARLAAWRSQIELIRARYGATASEPVPARLALDQIAQRRRGSIGMAIAASVAMFLIGGGVGWVARGASAASPSGFEMFTTDALDAYKLYAVEVRHPVEVPGDQRAHLVEWLSKRLATQLRAPELDKIGLKLVGGRLLPGPTGATAFFMYEAPSGERFTLYCARTRDPETALRYTTGDSNAAFYWVDRDLAYVVSGPAERDRLQQIATAAYEQIDTRAPQKPSGT
jgi:anti-sigma factor RsiW